MKHKLHSILLIAFGSTIICLLGYWLFIDLPQQKDIICWDEALYMMRGLDIPNRIPKGWGPLYGFWYLILVIGQKLFTQIHLVNLYYLNFQILAIGGSIVIYTLLFLNKIHPIAAFGIAVGYFFSTVNLETWPHISHFCVLFLLSSLVVSHFFKSYITKWLIAILAVFLLSYARPEFYLSFLALTAIFVGWLISKKFKVSVLAFAQIIIAVAVIIVVHLKMGAAMFGSESGNVAEGKLSRDIFAFAQHFALNYFNWNNIEQDFWLAWESHFYENFEVKDSLLSTCLSNSSLFIKHLTSNLGNWFYNTLDYITEIIFLGKIFRLPFWLRMVLSAFTLAFVLLRGWKIKEAWKTVSQSERGFIILVLLFFAGPTYIASILIYPRDHYLILQLPFLLTFLLFVFTKKSDFTIYNSAIGIGVVTLWALSLFPNRDKIDYFDFWQDRPTTYNYTAINYLKTFEIDDSYSKEAPFYLLENEGGLSIFVEEPKLRSIIGLDLKNENNTDIVERLEEYNINMIFVSPSLLRDPSLNTIPMWDWFISQPEKYGWYKQNLEKGHPYFLIKKEIQ